ncbi:hypothetical protein, partial [Palleronia sp.]|uniref:hypothetical protein n=1 Tax=Palleronia sp. TaxID=1940284 RepID=UPI0035C8588B
AETPARKRNPNGAGTAHTDKRRETGKGGGHGLALLGGAAVFVALYVLVHVLSVASSWIVSLWPF